MPAAWVGAAVAVAGAVNTAVNSGGSGSPGQPGGAVGGGASGASTYVPVNQSGSDTNIQALEGNLYNQDIANQDALTSAYQTQVGNLLNNPYGNEAQLTSNTVAQLGAGIANQGLFQGGQLNNLGVGVEPYASQILQTGFDPQNALYNRTQQQLTDQTNAQNAMSGLSGSPYGAGVANQANSNFNIDWQNQQLQRQATALQGYSGAVNTAGQAFSGSQGLESQALNTLQTTGQLPYQTYLGQGQNNLAALNSAAAGYTAAQQPTENLINNYNSYLGLGQSATGQALAGQAQSFNQGQQTGAALGQGLAGLSQNLGGLSNLFNSGPTTYQGGVTTGYNPATYDYTSGGSGDLMAA